MTTQVLSNARLWLGGFDWSGDMNALALKYGAEMKETTTLTALTRTRIPGLQTYGFQHEGYWNGGANNVDDAIFNQAFAVKNSVMSIDPQTGGGVEGDLAYFGQVEVATYSPGGKDGDVLAFSV